MTADTPTTAAPLDAALAAFPPPWRVIRDIVFAEDGPVLFSSADADKSGHAAALLTLAAAAPALLAALKQLHAALDGSIIADDDLEMLDGLAAASDALARAEGRA